MLAQTLPPPGRRDRRLLAAALPALPGCSWPYQDVRRLPGTAHGARGRGRAAAADYRNRAGNGTQDSLSYGHCPLPSSPGRRSGHAEREAVNKQYNGGYLSRVDISSYAPTVEARRLTQNPAVFSRPWMQSYVARTLLRVSGTASCPCARADSPSAGIRKW